MSKYEKWNPVIGLEHAYLISNKGNLKRVNQKVTKWLIDPEVNKVHVFVRVAGKTHSIVCATAVLEAFVSLRPKDSYVGFRDNDWTNCCLDNLYWTKKKRLVKKETLVLEAFDTKIKEKTWISATHFARELGVGRNTVIRYLSKHREIEYAKVILCNKGTVGSKATSIIYEYEKYVTSDEIPDLFVIAKELAVSVGYTKSVILTKYPDAEFKQGSYPQANYNREAAAEKLKNGFIRYVDKFHCGDRETAAYYLFGLRVEDTRLKDSK